MNLKFNFGDFCSLKNKSAFLFLLFLSISIYSNAQGINFQGVARSSNGTIIASANIGLRLSIISKIIDGTPEYVETKTVMTNSQGIFSIVVGDASNTTVIGNFKTISWADAPKFLKVEMDPTGGVNYINMGTTQLQYVPFSYYSLGVAATNVSGILPVDKGGTGVNSLPKLKAALNLDSVSVLVPTVSSTDPLFYSGNSVYINGNIVNDGGQIILKQGICYDTLGNPNISNSIVYFKDNISYNGRYLKGTFDNFIRDSLMPNTKYYYRTFAINKNGTGYSDLKNFTTKRVAIFTSTPTIVLNKNFPTVSFRIKAVGDTVNSCSVNFTNEGSSTGYNINLPNTFQNSINDTLISFTRDNNSSLSFNTDYKLSISINTTNGFNKSVEVPFRVESYTPTVNSIWEGAFTTLLSTSNGTSFNFSSLSTLENGSPITESGLCWSTSPIPNYIQNSKSIKSGINPISVTNLVPGTLYYFRGYAVNSIGVSYSNEVQVRMPTAPLNVPAVTLSSLNSNSVVAVYPNTGSDNGGAYINSSGLCWSTSHNPVNTLTTNISTNEVGVPITRTISGLSPSTTYYVRLYYTNSVGTSYGPEISFTTTP